MALMLSKTYAAFKAAGVEDDQAQAAAEELAASEAHFSSIGNSLSHMDVKVTAIDERMTVIEGKATGIERTISGLDSKIAVIEGKFSVLLWAVDINAAATIAILGVLLHRG